MLQIDWFYRLMLEWCFVCYQQRGDLVLNSDVHFDDMRDKPFYK
ncbi:hypothetical protein [Vibrio sp. VB16]|nr:hypothetical protein [Vibrio sp. VB16]